MNKKVRIAIGLISSLLICIYGVYGLLTENTVSGLPVVPIIFAVGGLIGFIGNIFELKK